MENFDGGESIPLRGMSVATFNVRTEKWHQTWVDNQGGYLDFEGEFCDNKMILVREAETENGIVWQRMVWYNITADSLDWNWERSSDGDDWELVWKIKYERSK
jgi:hypothetical protein